MTAKEHETLCKRIIKITELSYESRLSNHTPIWISQLNTKMQILSLLVLWPNLIKKESSKKKGRVTTVTGFLSADIK